jgi:hypothetical protein
MKLAIFLIGNIRTWDFCKNNFTETFKNHDVDLFVSVDYYRYGHHPAIQGRINDNKDEFINQEYLKEQFNGFNLKRLDIRPRISEAFKHVNPKFAQLSSSFSQIEKMNTIVNVVNLDGYDLAIKTRCDMMYAGFDIPVLGDKDVVVDSGNVHPNDCIIITNPNNMKDIYSFMYEEFFNPIFEDSHVDSPHRILLNALNYNKLNVQKNKMMDCVVRKNNIKEYY